jgi:hypothetical protein
VTLQDAIATGQLIATCVAGIAGLFISLAVYKLSTRQREDSWQLHFASIHDSFWKDEEYRVVRSWLSCQIAYEQELKTSLSKCLDANLDPSITPTEYGNLDKLDKFLNLMTRVIALDSRNAAHRSLLDALFFSYWLERAIHKTDDDPLAKTELYAYVKKYYPTIAKHTGNLIG